MGGDNDEDEEDLRELWEWDQEASYVTVKVLVPKDISADDICVRISSRRLEMGLQNAPPIAKFNLFDEICVSESKWRLADGMIWASLCKPNDQIWPKLSLAMNVVDYAACRNIPTCVKINSDTDGMD